MPPSNGTYVPTLAVRASEMNGMEFLPGVSKDRMVPVFLLAPWANSKSIERTIERIERAFRGRPYFLDVDRDYVSRSAESPAQLQWLELRSSDDGYRSWRNFWTQYAMVMPCLQLENQSEEQVRAQVEYILEQDREFCLRIEINRMPAILPVAISILRELDSRDVTVVIEGGWVQQPLTVYAAAHGLLTGELSHLNADIPMVVSCTSMLKGFTEIEGFEECAFSNHKLLDQLRVSADGRALLYGDWGSTRPREDSFGQAPHPRIDYATEEAWYFTRNRAEGWDYRRAAEVMINSRAWDGGLGIWGEKMIRDSAVNAEFAIDTAQKNVAARVNIHLHRQALYGEEVRGLDLDEEWMD